MRTTTASHRGITGPLVLAASLLFVLSTPARAQSALIPESGCGSLENAFGPFDYINPAHKREHLKVVEDFHFNHDVYALLKGMSGTVIGDIQYTLNAFPNHHLALDAIARLHAREGRDKLPSGRYRLECWFERAMRFQPADGMVPMIYGVHLFRTGNLTEAENYLARATELAPESAEAHYNLGLLRTKLGEYESAAESAERAYQLGFPLPGLRDQLEAHGITLKSSSR